MIIIFEFVQFVLRAGAHLSSIKDNKNILQKT